jgi:hypothetical protein
MKTYKTWFNANNVTTGQMCKWSGVDIKAESWEQAEEICRRDFPYLEVYGELVTERLFSLGKEIFYN